MRGLGQSYVKELKKLVDVADTALHEEHRACPICSDVSHATIEDMVDHIAQHEERVTFTVAPLEDRWIVLVEPHERYLRDHGRQKKKPLPESLRHLPTIARQMKALGIDPEWKTKC